MINAYVTSLIRTGVPFLVAWALSLKFVGPLLALFGWTSAAAQQRLDVGGVFVAGLAYYALARALERRWPRLGVLLGVPARPTYPADEFIGGGSGVAGDLAAETGARVVQAE